MVCFLAFGEVVQRGVFLSVDVLLVDYRVTMTERTSLHILATYANMNSFGYHLCPGQGLAKGPVDVLSLLKGLYSLCIYSTYTRMSTEVFGEG